MLVGRTKPMLSSWRPASVQSTRSSVFNLVWPSLMTDLLASYKVS